VVVSIQNKLFWNQVMSPFIQHMYDCIKFFIIRGIVLPCIIQFLTKVCNRPIFLTYDYSNRKSTRVTSHLKCFTEIWQNQNYLLTNLLFQQLETFLCFLHLVKIFMSFLDCVHHWCINSTKISDEFPVKNG
jgi:hypothetical protein